MKISIVLWALILLSDIALSQDTVININSFKTIPVSRLEREQILFKIINQKAYDYWEYRHVYETQDNNCPTDSLDCIPSIIYKYNVFETGNYKQINDSIKLSKINCKEGFWWIPPTGGELYFVTIKSNKVDSVVNRDDLFEFLKPFNSIDKISLYFENYVPLKYKRNNGNFEFIVYDTEKPIKYYENKNGHFNVFEKHYLRIWNDGRLYKKRMGEYHLKTTGSYAIS